MKATENEQKIFAEVMEAGLAKDMENLAKSFVGDDETAAKTVRLFGVDKVGIKERKKGRIILHSGTGEVLKEGELVFSNAGMEAGVPLEMEDIVVPTSPDESEASGDFTDSSPFAFVFGKVLVGTACDVEINSESEVVPGGQSVGAIVWIVGAVSGEKDNVDPLGVQKSVEKADAIEEFGMKTIQQIATAHFADGRQCLEGKFVGERFVGGGNWGGGTSRRCEKKSEHQAQVGTHEY